MNFFVIIAVLSFLLCDSEGTPFSRTAIVIRHCARSLDPIMGYDGPAMYPGFENYTSPNHSHFPAWGSEPMHCLPHALQDIVQRGQQLIGSLPVHNNEKKINIIADKVSRDNTTAVYLAQGLGVDRNTIVTDATIFHGPCPHLPLDEEVKIYEQRMRDYPRPANYDELMKSMQQNVLGLGGAAPPVYDIPNTVRIYEGKPYVSGGAAVASQFSEMFLMQTLGHISPVAWDTLSLPDDIYKYLPLHYYYRHIRARVPQIVKLELSNMLFHTADTLWSQHGSQNVNTENFTNIYVGHDTDLDGLATFLNLTWQPKQGTYPVNATPPISALRFDINGTSLEDAKVTMSFLYSPIGEPDQLIYVPAIITSKSPQAQQPIDLQYFLSLVDDVINASCTTPMASHDHGSSKEHEEIVVGFSAAAAFLLIVCIVGVFLSNHKGKAKVVRHDVDYEDEVVTSNSSLNKQLLYSS
eukprot:m.141558 g.141558  ORF g.141558 m.141558 type:complete len:466 (+) comp14852_c0_seq18:145-1542(+)